MEGLVVTKKSLAQRAYEGYWGQVSGYEEWNGLHPDIQDSWKDAADAVSLAVVESLFPEPTEDEDELSDGD